MDFSLVEKVSTETILLDNVRPGLAFEANENAARQLVIVTKLVIALTRVLIG